MPKKKTGRGRRKTASARKSKNTARKFSFKTLGGTLLLLLALIICAPQAVPGFLEDLSRQAGEAFGNAISSQPDAAETGGLGTPIPIDGMQSLPDDSPLRVDFLDVGQGLSVLVEADGRFLLYDGGDRSTSSFVVAYLKERGVEELDYLIASHYDADHINGLVGALNVFEVGQILGPDYEASSRVYDSLINTAAELGKEIIHPEMGSVYPIGDGYFEVLSPLSDQYSDANNYSITIRLVYDDISFLLTGDAEEESETEMLAAWPDLKSDVLSVGHHGSPSSSGPEFLDRVSPEYAVISCGKDNSYGHPSPSVLERLNQRGISYWRTDEIGTITAVSDGTDLHWAAEQGTSGSE